MKFTFSAITVDEPGLLLGGVALHDFESVKILSVEKELVFVLGAEVFDGEDEGEKKES